MIFWFWGYIRHMRTELQAHVQSQTRMEEKQNTASQHLYKKKNNNHFSLPQRYDDKTRNESKYSTTKQHPYTYPHKHRV